MGKRYWQDDERMIRTVVRIVTALILLAVAVSFLILSHAWRDAMPVGAPDYATHQR